MRTPESGNRGETSPSRHHREANTRGQACGSSATACPCGCRTLESCLPLKEASWRTILLSAEKLGSIGRITRTPQVMLAEWSRISAFVPCPVDTSELLDLNGDLLVRPEAFSHAYAAVERGKEMKFRSFWFAGPVEGHTFRLLLDAHSDLETFVELSREALRAQDFAAAPTVSSLVPLPTRVMVEKSELRSSWHSFESGELAETWAPGFPHLLRRDALAHAGMDLARPVSGRYLFGMLEAAGFAEMPLEVTAWANGVRHEVTLTQESRSIDGEAYRCAGQEIELHLRQPAPLALWLVQPTAPGGSPHLECFDEGARLVWRLGLASFASGVERRTWRAVLRKLGPVEL